MYKIYNKSYYNAKPIVLKINVRISHLYILKMILHNNININHIIMTLFMSSTYIPEILSMKQQNQLIQYWKKTTEPIELPTISLTTIKN